MIDPATGPTSGALTGLKVVDLTRGVLDAAEDLRRAAIAEDGDFRPFHIEVDFMVPYLSRAMDLVEPSVIEREILRYGGDRDEMVAHFSAQHPDKTPYRAILRIELFEPGGRRLPAYRGGKAMEVPLVDPQASESLEAAVSLNYPTHFTGYFILMMQRFAASL